MAIIISSSSALFLNGTGSHLLWDNLVVSNGATVTTNATNPSDLDFMFDYLNTTSFTPVTTSDLTVDIDFPEPTVCNAIALAGVNFAGHYLTSIIVRDESDTIIQAFDVSAYENNQPALLLFEPAAFEILKLEFVASPPVGEPQELLVLSNLYAGKTIEFPGQPDVGYQPGKWNNKRKTESFKTQTNAFGRSITVERGTEEVVNFSLLPVEFMDTDYKPFVQTHAGWPVFFAWDKINYPTEVIFGQVTRKANSVFTTGCHSSVGLTITGNI